MGPHTYPLLTLLGYIRIHSFVDAKCKRDVMLRYSQLLCLVVTYHDDIVDLSPVHLNLRQPVRRGCTSLTAPALMRLHLLSSGRYMHTKSDISRDGVGSSHLQISESHCG